jgi:hypothetical protein
VLEELTGPCAAETEAGGSFNARWIVREGSQLSEVQPGEALAPGFNPGQRSISMISESTDLSEFMDSKANGEELVSGSGLRSPLLPASSFIEAEPQPLTFPPELF